MHLHRLLLSFCFFQISTLIRHEWTFGAYYALRLAEGRFSLYHLNDTTHVFKINVTLAFVTVLSDWLLQLMAIKFKRLAPMSVIPCKF